MMPEAMAAEAKMLQSSAGLARPTRGRRLSITLQ
jgi:hypothetical protein